MAAAQADAHIKDAFAVWRARSVREWDLDISMISKAGIAVRPPRPGTRGEIAYRRWLKEQGQ